MSKATEKEVLEQIHHDVKSSVMSVKAYAQLLLRKTKTKLDKTTFDYVVRLDKQVDKLIDEVGKLELPSSDTSKKRQ